MLRWIYIRRLKGSNDSRLCDICQRKLMWKWICEWQWVMGGIGHRGLSVSVSASQILACCHLLYCGFALRLWIFHGKHLTPCPERYLKFFFFPDRNPGVRECHIGVKSLGGPQVKNRIYDAPADDIRWIFSFLSREPLCPPRLINHWAVHSLLLLLERSVCGVLLHREMISICSECMLCFDKLWTVSRLISVKLEWLSRGESAWISCVLNAAFSILHCPLAFS